MRCFTSHLHSFMMNSMTILNLCLLVSYSDFYRVMHVVLAWYCYRKSSVHLSVRLSVRDVKFSRPTWSRGQILRSRSRSHEIVLVLMHLGLMASTTHKPNRCRMSDSLLEELVFLKCNEWLQQTIWHMTFYWLFNNVMLIMISRGDNLTDAE